MKPGPVPDHDGHLVQAGGEGLDVVDDVGLGHHRAHELDEPLHRGGVEEVHADDLAGPPGAHRQLGDRQRGRVGREDRIGAAHLGQRREHARLELQVLRHRLDDEVGVGQIGERRRGADPRQQRVGVLLGSLAARDRPAGRGVQVGEAAGDGVVVDLRRDHVQAVAGEDLDEVRTHRAQADDTDRSELPCHAAPSTGRSRDTPRRGHQAVVTRLTAVSQPDEAHHRTHCPARTCGMW